MAQNVPEGFVARSDGCICPIEKVEEEEVKEERKRKRRATCPYDPRFPNTNQTKHCYTSFVDFQRCARLLGKYPGCMLFYRCYTSLCPSAWIERWFEQMENGTFPKKIYPAKPIVKLDKDAAGEYEDDNDEGSMDDAADEPPC